MKSKGLIVGALIGGLFKGFAGLVIGALIGYFVGREADKEFERLRRAAQGGDSSSPNREMVFCASVAAMLAKLAKADGRVTADEIESVERAFRRLGFSRQARDYAIAVFRKAKDDSLTIYAYAREFAAVVDSVEVRELFYELLWDLARADGEVSPVEIAMLRDLPAALGISPEWFAFYARSRGGRGGGAAPQSRDSLADAYATLGVASTASDDEVRRAYREKAKSNHPDALRAQGLPEAMVGRANERMAAINAAWTRIKSARGL